MTVFADINAALAAALAGAAEQVREGFVFPLPTTVDSMIWVRPEYATSELTGIVDGPRDWETTWYVQIGARFSPDAESPIAAVDPILDAVFTALHGFSSDGVMQVIPGGRIAWDYTATDANVIGCSVTLTVVHRTTSSTLSA